MDARARVYTYSTDRKDLRERGHQAVRRKQGRNYGVDRGEREKDTRHGVRQVGREREERGNGRLQRYSEVDRVRCRARRVKMA